MLFTRDTLLATVAWSTWTSVLADPGAPLTHAALAAVAALAGLAVLHLLRLAVLLWVAPHWALTTAAVLAATAADAAALRALTGQSGTASLHFATGLVAAAAVSRHIHTRRHAVTEARADNNRLRLVATERIAAHHESAATVLSDIEALLSAEVARHEGQSSRTTMLQLRRVPADVMRPITHEIKAELLRWIPEVPAPPAATPVPRLDPVAAQRPLVLAGALGGVTLVAYPLAAPLVMLLTWISSHLVRRIMAMVPPQSGSALTTWTGLGLMLAALPAGLAEQEALALVVGTAPVVGITVLLATSAAQQAALDESELLANTAQLQWTTARIGLVDWFQRSEASRALHGPVQTVVTAAVPRIEAAISAGEPTFAVIGELQRRIVHSLGPLVNPRAEALDIERELGDIVETWAGIATVEYLMDPDFLPPLSTDPACAMAVVDAVAEAVSDAVRECGATRAVVTLSHTPGTTFLSVSDNGSVRSPLDTSLSWRMLDTASLSWFRKHTFGRNLVNASLPYRPDADAAWAIASA